MLKIPLYPFYSSTITFLKLIDGEAVSTVKEMWNRIHDQRGTPQNPLDWTDPDTWIPQRLDGVNKTLAYKIWRESDGKINPRHISGEQFLINGYSLIEEMGGKYRLTERGKIFITDPYNDVMREIDQSEGLIYLLLLAETIGGGKRSDFIPEWKNYLDNNSNVEKESVVNDYLRRRLANLVGRGYLTRDGNSYQITQEGLAYLEFVNQTTSDTALPFQISFQRDVEKFKKEQRLLLRQFLEQIPPFRFELLIRDLLEKMGYDEVEVTSPTNDKGVDVKAVIQKGITLVREVIQVKRYTKSNIQRPELDRLRGSLHRFDAFLGTIITLSDFAQGAKDAALEKGVAPITLINGEKLIDMLIEKNLGIKNHTITYFTVDNEYFDQLGSSID